MAVRLKNYVIIIYYSGEEKGKKFSNIPFLKIKTIGYRTIENAYKSDCSELYVYNI